MNPCERCIIKALCTVLCGEKIKQIENKLVARKKLTPRGGTLLSDFIDELWSEGKTVIRWSFENNRIEVMR